MANDKDFRVKNGLVVGENIEATSGLVKTQNIQLSSTTPTIWFNGTSDGGDGASSDMSIVATPEGLDFREPEDGNKIHFQILDDLGVNSPFGYRVGATQVIDSSGNVKKSPTITLSGDVTGSGTLTDLGSVTITTTVANDSHSHSNYVLKTGDTMTGDLTLSYADASSPYHLKLHNSSNANGVGIQFSDTTLQNSQWGSIEFYHSDVQSPGSAYGTTFKVNTSESTGPAFVLDADGDYFVGTNKVFNDGYHPNADKWTTARTNTVTLTGSVTGTGSASVDGSGNWTVTVPTTTNHTHNYDNYGSWTAEDGDGTTYTVTSGDTLKFAEGTAIDVNFTADDVLTISHADTSSQASVNNSNGTVIQDVTLDTNGHVTGLASVNLDTRYVNITGDTMTGTLEVPQIDFIESTNTISATMLSTDTLSFSGDSGQLFSITDSLSGTIFAVNDISGVPSIEVDDDGTIRLAETFGNVLIGTAVDDGANKVQIVGDTAVTGNLSASGNFYINGNTAISSSRQMYGTIFYDANNTAYYTDPASTSNINILNVADINRDPVVTLSGDVSGSATMTNLGSINITTTVANDSHSHSNYILSNADDSYSGNITATGIGWYLWSLGARGASAGQYGIGNRNDDSYRQLTFHIPNLAAYSNTGTVPSFGWYSNGAQQLMKLESATAKLSLYTGSINLGYDIGTTTNSIGASNWFRSSGNTGWYNGTHGGGIYMTDTTWVRTYNNKAFLSENTIQSNNNVRAPIFYDTDNTAYFVNPTNTSNINILNVADINRDPTVTLSGDVTGSATMTNLGSINITTTVGNDSHSHSNYMLKYNGASTADYDTLTTNGVWRNTGGANGPYGTSHATGFVALQSDTNYGWQLFAVSENNIALRFKGTSWSGWSKIFNDGYHPNADKWTTARTNTVTLTGSVTGTGSASVDGSGNWTVTVPTTTNHTHNYDNYGSWTAEDGDGTTYTVTSGDVLKFAEGSGINVNFSADDVLRIEYKGNEIPGSVDLNTYRTTGFYAQNANADAASGSNYPTANAGILQVINDDYGNGLHTTQLYSQYNSTNYYHRTYYNGTWSSWRNLAQDTTYTVGNGSMTVTAGGGLTGGGQVGTANQTGSSSVTISHADTSSQASVNNSNGTVIQDITLDTYGHITAIGSVNLDGRYQLIAAPAAPTITNTTLSGETVEIVFSQSATSGVNGYEIWSDGGGVSFALIGRIPAQDIAASMSFVDTTFTDTGTINYRVYAIRNGVYSSAATTNVTFSVPSLDVANFAAIPDLNAFHLQYDLPVTRFLDHIEIYLDTNAASGSLARANATLIYSGDNPSYTHNISASDRDNYHQFWVECVGVA